MTEPSDGARLLLTVLFAAWLAAFVISFITHGLTFRADEEARAAFVGWQAIAGLFAIAIFGVSRNWPRQASVRRLALVPVVIAVLLSAGFAGFFLWIRVG